MAEYIVRIPPDMPYEIRAELNAWYIASEPIVRCRDCKYYYEAEEYHPQGNYDRRCCKYFDTYNDEVEPDGFCKWGERRDAAQ